MIFFAGVVVKYLAESAWCRRGLSLFGGPSSDPISTALRFGFVRLLLGRAVLLLVSEIRPNLPEPLLYAILIAIRWLEWSLIADLIARRRVRSRSLLFGADRRSRLWQAGGVLVSCFADVPALMAGAWVGDLWA